MSYNYFEMFSNFTEQHTNSVNGLKQRAIDEYYEALKMPRKKKKIAKKAALQLHAIACWGENLI